MKPAVLLVDDDPDTLCWLLDNIPKQIDIHLIAVENVTQMEKAISTIEFSLIVTDFRMPERDGSHVLHALNERGLKIPVIFYTSEPNQIQSLFGLEGQIVKKPEFEKLVQTMLQYLK
jgi:DNA-binding NtrC family response regulator